MNYGSIRYIIGWILKVEAALMTLPMIVSVVYRERTGLYFVMAALLCLGAGVILSLKKAGKNDVLCQRRLYIGGPRMDRHEYYGMSSFCVFRGNPLLF